MTYYVSSGMSNPTHSLIICTARFAICAVPFVNSQTVQCNLLPAVIAEGYRRPPKVDVHDMKSCLHYVMRNGHQCYANDLGLLVSLYMQDFKSLCAAVTICALMKAHTDRQHLISL